MKKQHYESPSSESIVLALDATVMMPGSPFDFGNPGKPGGDLIEDDPLGFDGFGALGL